MTFRFGDFELDEACRELRFRRQPLRCAGREAGRALELVNQSSSGSTGSMGSITV